ncbi:unnamed protein product [Periconia digitata]|uniref:Heterokaryon incompatibility domain-containing protein n=1 Tax=Periconia digitata TaxID=1303443 RepID=A0A9W4URB8_9PLEO|nr:unnamed protein product [Periconia digitata]
MHERVYESTCLLARTLCRQRKYDDARKELMHLPASYAPLLHSEGLSLVSLKHWSECDLHRQSPIPNFRKSTRASVLEYVLSAPTCLYCRLLLNAIDLLYPGWTSTRRDMKFIQIWDIRQSWKGQPFIQLRRAGEGLTEGRFDIIEIRIECDEDSVWPEDPRGSFSTEEWESINSWVNECVGSHSICRVPDHSYVPRRLLQVGNELSGPRLVLREAVGEEDRRYCALSYCWGPQNRSLTTTRENLSQHLKGMAFDSIPQTMQDAMIICRFLSVPYLWVDALCIVQNDIGEKDWIENSNEMYRIYSNAHLVISADASPRNTFGFLPGRDHIEKQWRHISVRDETQNRYIDASVRSYDNYANINYDGRAWGGTSVHPLRQRGWALQESMLANRRLRFTTTGIQWDCNHYYQDEMGLMSRTIRLAKLMVMYPNLMSKLRDERSWHYDDDEEASSRHRYITSFMDQETSAPIYLAWQGIVSYYSSRDLTQISDKLSALSGLARLISEALSVKPGSYLAGHWRDDLASSLLWYVSQPERPNRSSPYRAPSWSWASVNGQIQYFREGYQFHFMGALSVQEAHSSASSLDEFGRVDSGRLIVTGLIAPVSLHIEPTQRHRIQYTGGGGCAGHPYKDQFSWVTSPRENGAAASNEDVPYYEVLLDDKILSESLLPTSYFCLLVGRHYDTVTGGSRAWWLVLRQTLTDDKCYQRIGIGYFQEYSKELHIFITEDAKQSTVMLI